MRENAEEEPGFAGPSTAHPIATPSASGIDSMSKVTIDNLPTTVTPDETLARNRALWPVATSDCAGTAGDEKPEEERRSEDAREK